MISVFSSGPKWIRKDFLMELHATLSIQALKKIQCSECMKKLQLWPYCAFESDALLYAVGSRSRSSSYLVFIAGKPGGRPAQLESIAIRSSTYCECSVAVNNQHDKEW